MNPPKEILFEDFLGYAQFRRKETILSCQICQIAYPDCLGREFVVSFCPPERFNPVEDHFRVGGFGFIFSSQDIFREFQAFWGPEGEPIDSVPYVYQNTARRIAWDKLREAEEFPDRENALSLSDEHSGVVARLLTAFFLTEILRQLGRFEDYRWVMFYEFPEILAGEGDPEPWAPGDPTVPRSRYITIPVETKRFFGRGWEKNDSDTDLPF